MTCLELGFFALLWLGVKITGVLAFAIAVGSLGVVALVGVVSGCYGAARAAAQGRWF